MSAATTCEGGKQQFPSVADGNGNAPVIKYPSFKAPKPTSFTDASKHSSIDVFPLLVKEAAFPLKQDRCIDHSLVQDVCTISILPDDEGNTIPQCTTTSQFTLLSFVKSLLPSKSQMLVDNAQLNCQKTQNRINVLLGGTDSYYQSCVVDINVEKGNGAEAEEGEVVASLKSENVHMQKVLQRQASLSTEKAISERCHDATTNRWRRYKRAASFDSRKVVILFSILSSVGTLILIYLTLRVRLINGDNSSFNHM